MRSAPLFLTILAGSIACGEPDTEEIEEVDSPTHAEFFPDLPLLPQTLDAGAPPTIDTYEVELYVSPMGDDSDDGSLEQPLRTFEGARDRVRTLRDGAGHIIVYFRDGEYVLDETLVFGTGDSGTQAQVITYAAYPGEKPVVSSLQSVSGWEPHDGAIVRAPLPEGLGHIRFLWAANSGWLPRSATELFLTDELSPVEESCLECNWNLPDAQSNRLNVHYPSGFAAPSWAFADQYDLRQSTISWVQEILPIARVDEDEQRIWTTIPASLEMRLNFEEAERFNRNWVLNSVEGIDEPGEWAVIDGYIYLYPATPNDDIRAPRLTELIRVDDGTADGNSEITAPVSHLRFDGLTFTGADFYVMKDDDITIQHDWSVVDAPTALLRLRNTENIVVENCAFVSSGGTGLRFDRHAQQNHVYANRFEDLGREAVVFIGRGPGYGDVNHDNEVSFNDIERTGLEKWTAPAIVFDQSTNNRIHHNFITDTQFSAIVLTAPRQLAFASYAEEIEGYLGREFHYYEIAQSIIDGMKTEEDELYGSYKAMKSVLNHSNLVELNTLLDVGQGAGYLINGRIYNSATTRGESNFINYNYIHNTRNHGTNNAAFYSDADQDYCSYVGNMVSGIRNDDEEPEVMPIFLIFAIYAEGEFNEGTKIASLGNAVVDSTYPKLLDGTNVGHGGTLTDMSGGGEDFMPIYSAMASVLDNAELPRRGEELPGEARMLSVVDSAIERHGQ